MPFTTAEFDVGIGYALWLRYPRPDVYAEIGRTVMADSHERS
ncbi:hypothetical protein [Mycolicibacterium austroafricanum]|nr:hypothetical protein [Mycolicibacterium austroafricanum]